MKQLTQPKIDWQEVFERFGDDKDALIKSKIASLLACGMTLAQVAEETGASTQQIAAWRDTEKFQSALLVIKENLEEYLDSGLARKYMRASERIDWILAIDVMSQEVPEKLKLKLLEEQQKAARLVYEAGMMPKEKATDAKPQNVTVAVLNMSDSAAKVLLDRVPEIKEIGAAEED